MVALPAFTGFDTGFNSKGSSTIMIERGLSHSKFCASVNRWAEDRLALLQGAKTFVWSSKDCLDRKKHKQKME